MITSTRDVAAVTEALDDSDLVDKSFNLDEWLSSPYNLALTNPDGDVGLFEYNQPGLYTGHYFFKSRGARAIQVAVDMLEEMFFRRGARVIRGLTPSDKRAAAFVTRRLGFQSYGFYEFGGRQVELFILGLNEFCNLHRKAT